MCAAQEANTLKKASSTGEKIYTLISKETPQPLSTKYTQYLDIHCSLAKSTANPPTPGISKGSMPSSKWV